MTLRLALLATVLAGGLAATGAAAQTRAPLDDALRALAEQRGLRLVYAPALVAGVQTSCPAATRTSARPAEAVLDCILGGTGLEARRLPSGTVALYRAVALRPAAPPRLAPQAPPGAQAPRLEAPRATHTVSGFVTDAVTGEALIGATVVAAGLRRGTATNTYGFFSLPLPEGSVRVEVRYVGYAPHAETLRLSQDVRLDVTLEAAAGLTEVVVEAGPAGIAAPGAVRLTAQDVERVPALLGEADPLKALQLSPAVHAGAEGTAGLHVRGGSPDQTLLLLDGAPVYNASHLAGAVSVFNSDALQSAMLVPGAPPARYGDRLSAVVDVTQREGSRERRQATATIGLLASRAIVEGPVAGGRGAFLVSVRRSYADLLLRPLLFVTGASAGYALSDLSAKVNLDLNDRTRVFASAYTGADRFGMSQGETFVNPDPLLARTESESTRLGWGNQTATVRATHLVTPRVFASGLAYVSRYAFRAEREAGNTYPEGSTATSRTTRFEQTSGLLDLAVQADVEASAEALGLAHDAAAGLSIGRRTFRPAAVLRSQTTGADEVRSETADRIATLGGSAYVSDAVRLGRVRLEVGLRLGVLGVRGRIFAALQPRLAASAPLGAFTVRASGGRTWQPMHLLANPGIGLPTDLWVPATERVRPEAAWQGALEVERALGRGWRASAGAFAKTMMGLVEYADGAGFFNAGAQWEDEVTTGTGRASGIEFGVQRSGGRTDVQLGYSRSRSTRTFAEIDLGQTFPYRYDRTHDLSLAVTRHLSPRRRVTALLVYATGAAVTVPVARYGGNAFVYSRRNAGRFPAYARADVSYEVDYGRGRLALGLYNATNRLNPFYGTFGEDYDERTQTYSEGTRYVSIFPILPSVSYRFTIR